MNLIIPTLLRSYCFIEITRKTNTKKLLSNKQINNNFTKPQKFATESIGHKILKWNTNIFQALGIIRPNAFIFR